VARSILALALTALPACGSKETEQTQGASFGKVLPGSASDAMLPYDTASSSPPLAPETYEPLDDEPEIGVRPKKAPAATVDDVAPEAEPT
jgi:hypothetical protein